LIDCALRRNELALAELEIETIQQREGRWVLIDLEGKGRRICDNPTRILAGGVLRTATKFRGKSRKKRNPRAKIVLWRMRIWILSGFGHSTPLASAEVQDLQILDKKRMQ
jgi:hypothetical protein